MSHHTYRFKRIFLIVLDSVGIGAMPDADQYGDEGAHTLKHVAEQMKGIKLPNLEELGLGHIAQVMGVTQTHKPIATYGRMMEASVGKDTMTGHWELMGLHIDVPFRTFTDSGFPLELMEQFEQLIDRKTLGNKAASGTEIIKELGQTHMQTGYPIVYTSADSVFQLAGHEAVISLRELYRMCEIARRLTAQEPYMLGRVIARPFIGQPGSFERTANRRDYALKPFAPTVLDGLKQSGLDSIALGKINDIFDGEGITAVIKTKSNSEGMDRIIETTGKDFTGLCFLNLVDFDAIYGHRRDPIGYGQALEAFDLRLEELLQRLHQDDLLIITADHGNDPTHHGTDHTRELVPLLAYSPSAKKGCDIGTRETFADVGATLADNFNIPLPKYGTSFLTEIY